MAYGSIDRNDPQSIETAETIQIDIRGVPPNNAGAFTRIVNEAVGDKRILWPASATDYKLVLRREAAAALRQETLTRTIDTLERKMNGLGVAEASVQRRGGSEGEAEILVQLPGVDDPARVEDILQTTAMLELCEVKGGPYASAEALRAAHGGILPLNSRILRGSLRSGGGENWWLLARSSVVTGRDLCDSRAQQSEGGLEWESSTGSPSLS